jgi:hypothetical protein
MYCCCNLIFLSVSVKAIKHLQETLTMQDLASNFSKFSWEWQTSTSTRWWRTTAFLAISVQAEIISLILYHNSTFIITNLSKPDEISFVVGECHLNSEASLPPHVSVWNVWVKIDNFIKKTGLNQTLLLDCSQCLSYTSTTNFQ